MLIIKYLTLLLMLIAIVASAIRLLIGPSPFDRVLALEAMGLNFVAVIVFQIIAFGKAGYIDVVLIIVLLSFLITVFTAIFLEDES